MQAVLLVVVSRSTSPLISFTPSSSLFCKVWEEVIQTNSCILHLLFTRILSVYRPRSTHHVVTVSSSSLQSLQGAIVV
ncbi:hypothetical protein BD413DRAFT_24186 [Trametes elegans]|nr:hypothetical protein BD413DRAFT_24186 [Trametes elegans]